MITAASIAAARLTTPCSRMVSVVERLRQRRYPNRMPMQKIWATPNRSYCR